MFKKTVLSNFVSALAKQMFTRDQVDTVGFRIGAGIDVEVVAPTIPPFTNLTLTGRRPAPRRR
jgi:hypothetical protein